jgi:succinyl-CoA synthetase beta subunit/citryl-CoA synthetase large subunit
MRLYEWEAKRLLAERGLPTPSGELVARPDEARSVAGRWPKTVLKAQVLHGGRMKAGLVQFAETAEAAERLASGLLAPDRDSGSERVLVEERLPILEERFLGVLYDSRRRQPVLVYTPKGGIDVESDGSDSIVSVPLDARGPIEQFRLRAALSAAGVKGGDLRALTGVAVAVAQLFLDLDATLVEINPLARIEGRGWMALDAHIELDGDALGRHPDLVDRFSLGQRGDDGRSPSATEQAAREVDALDHRGVAGRLVEFDGDVGLIIGGGGASLTVFDAIRDAGGHPANYCEVGGNPSVRKITAFTRLLLDRLRPDRLAVIMNVVSNTRADLVARGVIAGCIEAGRSPKDTIAVFRVPGAWEKESRDLLRHYEVHSVGREVDIDSAARVAVEIAQP